MSLAETPVSTFRNDNAGLSLAEAGIDLYLVRHGFAAHNLRPDKLDGNGEPALISPGPFEATQAGAYLGGQELDLIITGTKRRVYETYDRASEFMPDVPAIFDSALNEQDYGKRAGHGKKAVFTNPAFLERAAREGYAAKPHRSAESGQQVHDRAMQAIVRHALAHVGRPADRNIRVAAFTHSATAKNLAGIQLGIPREQMFARGAFPMANGEVWLLRPGAAAPKSVFVPKRVTPGTMPRRQAA